METKEIRVIAGASRRTGVGKQSGQPYDMCMLQSLSPMKSVDKPGNRYVACGYEVKELEASPEAIDQCMKLADRFPCRVELTIGAYFDDRGNMRPRVDAVEVAKAAQPVQTQQQKAS